LYNFRIIIGVRKIILSTNIAETSVTIDDVVYVINNGRMKLKGFDAENNIGTLNEEWVSLANSRQRRGRAGRVRPGICYHLYTRGRERSFSDYVLPEMMRTSLEEVILQAKILQVGMVTPFLEKVMNPPETKTLEVALKVCYGLFYIIKCTIIFICFIAIDRLECFRRKRKFDSIRFSFSQITNRAT